MNRGFWVYGVIVSMLLGSVGCWQFVIQMPAATEELKHAVSSGDKGEMHRAFTEITYHRRQSELVPALRSFLQDSNPYVRYLAAQHLFIAGDETGYKELLSLAQEDAPIAGLGKEDVRVSAARTLAKYHQTGAADTIIDLFKKTQNYELSVGLSVMGVSLPASEQHPFVPSELALEQYAESKEAFFSPQIASLFQSTKDAELKAAAAWSLATLTGDQAATDYLAQQARLLLADETQGGSLIKRHTVKYLGTLQTPEAKRILEEALNDHDQTTAQIALVNLLYNQGGSEKALQKIADQLADSSHATLSWPFLFDVCTKLSGETIIQEAARKFEQHDDLQEWQRYVLDRRNWPIYNWIEDYVVKLNK